EAAELVHLLVVVGGVDGGAAAEEEERLEKGVRHEVEHGDIGPAAPEGDEHEAELADGGIGEDFLDIGLGDGHEAGEDGGDEANDGDDEHRPIGDFKERQEPGTEVDAGDDHGGGVDEGADGRRALHGIGEPHVKRDLRAFAHAAEEDKHDADEEVGVADLPGLRLVNDVLDVEGPGSFPEKDDADEEPNIADACGDERLFCGLGGAALFPVEADEEEGAEAHELPAHVDEEQVVGEDEHEHGADEVLEDGEEPVVARLAFHVADRKDVDHEADAGDHAEHDDRYGVDVNALAKVEVADIGPIDGGEDGGVAAGVEEIVEDEEEEDERSPDGEDAKVVPFTGEIAPKEGKHQEHARRDSGEQPGLFSSHASYSAPSTISRLPLRRRWPSPGCGTIG